jgi:BirA family biotin operon repressor/biotin-[acetyl-CoA-carboxylase] ligase
MRTIKVSATDSTNVFLRELHRRNIFFENLCLVAQNQTKGRGQRGAGWDSEPGKNLTFSLLLQGLQLPAQQHFKLNAAVSLALVAVLAELQIENLSVKWPNDILSGNCKIAGILVENVLKNGNIKDSVVGIGLNVNQENFSGLPKAASLKSITGKDFDLEVLLKKLSTEIESKVFDYKNRKIEEVLEKYHQHLFRMGKVSDFELSSGEKIQGEIIGVSEEGKLLVDTEKGKKEFLLKEVKLQY